MSELFELSHFVDYASRIKLDNGVYWQVEPFQATIIDSILTPVRARINGDESGGHEVWAILPEGNAKHLSVDTPLPTPNGWTTMLDVMPGDEVLNADGEATVVRYVSPVQFGKDCYRVCFSDGAAVVCSGEHLWEVEDGMSHYERSVRSTEWLAARLKIEKGGRSGRSTVARWRVRTARRAERSGVELPIDPYVLGVWLGDGASADGRVTNVDSEVWDQLGDCSHDHAVASGRACTRTVFGLKAALRAAGLLSNKHIPPAYLIADEEDRWRLLQGLVDTDGTVSKAGQVTFAVTQKRLAEDFRALVWSLGLPCSWREDRAKLGGRDCGPCFRLTVSCDARHPVCSVKRKCDRLKTAGRTCDHRRIVAVEQVESVPVRCIEVEADDSLYLCGEAFIPTHNTTLMAGLSLYLADWCPLPWIPVGASTRDQAEILAQQAYQMIRMSPGMQKRFRIYEGYRRIQPIRAGHPGPGRHGIKVMAADSASGDGVIPFPIAICDEGHRHKDMRLYRTWRGKLLKRSGVLVMISTAGNPGHEFEQLRDHIRKKAKSVKRDGAHVVATAPDLTMHEWQVPDEKWATDMERVKEANPLSAITVADLQAQFDSPTTDIGLWKRLKANIPTRPSTAAVSAQEWDGNLFEGELPAGAKVDLGVDVAFHHDTFAIVPLVKIDKNLRVLGKPIILEPPRDGSGLHPSYAKEAFREFVEAFNVVDVVMDTTRAEDVAAWLEDECGVRVIDWAQGNAQKARDYEAFMEGLRNGTLKHTGDPELRQHVMNAVSRPLPGDKRMFDRPSSSRSPTFQDERVIDALAAASFVNCYANAPAKNVDISAYRIRAV